MSTVIPSSRRSASGLTSPHTAAPIVDLPTPASCDVQRLTQHSSNSPEGPVIHTTSPFRNTNEIPLEKGHFDASTLRTETLATTDDIAELGGLRCAQKCASNAIYPRRRSGVSDTNPPLVDAVKHSGQERCRALCDPSAWRGARIENLPSGLEVPTPGPMKCRASQQPVDSTAAFFPLRDIRIPS